MIRWVYLMMIVTAAVAPILAQADSRSDGLSPFQRRVEAETRVKFKLQGPTTQWLKTIGADAQDWLEGYAGGAKGDVSRYRGHLSPPGTKMPTRLVRSTDGTMSIAWETEPVRVDFSGQTATFVWSIVVGSNYGVRPLDLYVNDTHHFVIRTQKKAQWRVAGDDGGIVHFDSMFTDDRGVQCGYMRLVAPKAWLAAGQPLQLKIAGPGLNHKAYFMLLEFTETARLIRTLRQPPDKTAFGEMREELADEAPLVFYCLTRAAAAGKTLELRDGKRTLATAELQHAQDLATAKILLRPTELDTSAGVRVTIVVDGEASGHITGDPFVAKARGILQRAATVREKLQAGQVPDDHHRAAIMVLARGEQLAGLLTETEPSRLVEIRRRVPTGPDGYQKLLEALEEYAVAEDTYAKRRGTFHCAYISAADDSPQIYSLYVPEDYDPGQHWPLYVGLHGYSGTYNSIAVPQGARWLAVAVDGRGQLGYNALAELDVLEVIAEVRRHYAVDQDRIYIGGGSMGGSGTWRLASRYPDLFAAARPVASTWPDGARLMNLAHVPVWNLHGDADYSAVIDGSRAIVNMLRDMGARVIHTEVPGGTHAQTSPDPSWDINGWMLAQRRNPFPQRVQYTTGSVQRGRAFWVEVLEFTNPNVPATIHAQVSGRGQTQHLYLWPTNIDVLAVDLPAQLFDSKAPLTLVIDAAPTTVNPPLPKRLYVQRLREPDDQTSAHAVSTSDPRPARKFAPYVTGGFEHIYACGEPLRIVNATGGEDPSLREAIERFCEALSKKPSGADWPPGMPLGKIPIVADTELKDEEMQECNLIIVGPASANQLLARITKQLPAIERDGAVIIEGESYPLSTHGYAMFHYNPLAPERYIAVLSSEDAGQFYLLGNNLFHEVNGEKPFGLAIDSLADKRRVRRIAWDKDWHAPKEAFTKPDLPRAFLDAGSTQKLMLEARSRATGADFVVYEPREGPGWDVRKARWHDVCAWIGPRGWTFTSMVTGEELIEMLRRDEPLSLWPEVKPSQLQPEGRYRVCFEPRMTGRIVGPRRRNLSNVQLVSVDLVGHIRRAALRAEAGIEATTPPTQ